MAESIWTSKAALGLGRGTHPEGGKSRALGWGPGSQCRGAVQPGQREGTWEEVLELNVVTYACPEEGRSEHLWATKTGGEAAAAGHDCLVMV